LHGIYAEYEKEGVDRPQMGNRSPYAYANSFQAEDGWVFVSITRNGVWRRFLKAAGMEEVGKDPRFKSDWERSRNSDPLDELITPWISSKKVEEIISLLEKAGVPCARVNTISQACSEPQYREREIFVDMEHGGTGKIPTLGVILKLSETPGNIRKGAPAVGEDNGFVYRELLGYEDSELVQLKQEGII
jgi:crotonobetainyl-CoA:carnitine CoA-transferase CaiB-like acyl-CoA transferase